jgi:hypothetical protein
VGVSAGPPTSGAPAANCGATGVLPGALPVAGTLGKLDLSRQSDRRAALAIVRWK